MNTETKHSASNSVYKEPEFDRGESEIGLLLLLHLLKARFEGSGYDPNIHQVD